MTATDTRPENTSTGRQTLILGNWKMHGSQASNAMLLDALLAGVRASALPSAIQLAVCAPTPYLAQVQSKLTNTPVQWGAQDVSEYPAGVHTGEVSASMLADFGVRWVLAGHSERRLDQGEDSLLVARKVQAALTAGLSPVVCVGETLAQREAGQTDAVIREQLRPLLDFMPSLPPPALERITFAYEPVWAIGSGQSASPKQAQAVHASIRAQLAEAVGAAAAENCLILYGGSVKAGNAADLLTMPDVDGVLVGSASLDAEEFLRIAAAARPAQQQNQSSQQS